ncbi:hypothetical protein SOVF_205290 isoform A, partial [Spinacia oleracea]
SLSSCFNLSSSLVSLPPFSFSFVVLSHPFSFSFVVFSLLLQPPRRHHLQASIIYASSSLLQFAHDICNDSNRQIIDAGDLFNALEEVEFSEFVDPLRAALDER